MYTHTHAHTRTNIVLHFVYITGTGYDGVTHKINDMYTHIIEIHTRGETIY